MSRQAIAAVIARSDLASGERLVALSLASFANREHRAWPGAPAASARAGLRRSRYQEAREELVRRGLVAVDERATGRGRASTISLTFADTGPWWDGEINVELFEAVLSRSHACVLCGFSGFGLSVSRGGGSKQPLNVAYEYPCSGLTPSSGVVGELLMRVVESRRSFPLGRSRARSRSPRRPFRLRPSVCSSTLTSGSRPGVNPATLRSLLACRGLSWSGFHGGLFRGFYPRERRPSSVMPRPRKYPDDLIQRGIRLVFESGRPISHVARDLGLPAETLRKRVRQAEADSAKRTDLLSSEEREEIRALTRDGSRRRRNWPYATG